MYNGLRFLIIGTVHLIKGYVYPEEGCMMEIEKRKFLEGVYPYFVILDNLNIELLQLIRQNTENQLHENQELFYKICSDLIRLYPIKFDKNSDGSRAIETAHIDKGTGILLLSKYIPFLQDEFNRLIKDEKCTVAFSEILTIRNKYTHEPHNMRFSYYIGGDTSCTIGMYYKDKSLSISTIWLTNILCELNLIFERIKDLYMDVISKCDDKYKEYPCCMKIYNCHLSKYNEYYNKLPWRYIIMDDEDCTRNR